MASRAAMKLLSRVSRRTKENIPSNMSTKFSPYSSYCQRYIPQYIHNKKEIMAGNLIFLLEFIFSLLMKTLSAGVLKSFYQQKLRSQYIPLNTFLKYLQDGQ